MLLFKLKHPALLDEALTILGPLPPEEQEAARLILLDACKSLFALQGESYQSSLKTLKAAGQDVRRLRQTLNSLNPDLIQISLSLAELFNPFPPPGSKYLPEDPNEPRFYPDIVLRVIEERLRAAQVEVAQILKVKGGHGSLRSRIYGPPKDRFANECSTIWLLTGNSLEDGKSGELVRFTHLAYEAATGDEDGQGLRDKIASAKKGMRELLASGLVIRAHAEILERRIGRETREKGVPDPYSVA